MNDEIRLHISYHIDISICVDKKNESIQKCVPFEDLCHLRNNEIFVWRVMLIFLRIWITNMRVRKNVQTYIHTKNMINMMFSNL